MTTTRQNKMARLIQKELSSYFQMQTKIQFGGQIITPTQVRVAPDFGYAKVYVSIFPQGKYDETVSFINENVKEIRYWLGQRVRHQMRVVPELLFSHDDSLDYIEKIENLLKKK